MVLILCGVIGFSIKEKDMRCKKCKKEFNAILSSCGTGYSWGLYRCPYCKQLHAKAYQNGFIPKEVLKDEKIIVLKP